MTTLALQHATGVHHGAASVHRPQAVSKKTHPRSAPMIHYGANRHPVHQARLQLVHMHWPEHQVLNTNCFRWQIYQATLGGSTDTLYLNFI